ncbi:MAG: SulP family inorganic anion transporter [Gammaproteobacteria bacterium]|nr:SulP family inorganic anion transporter [Gammaproteobacteria bacterium]
MFFNLFTKRNGTWKADTLSGLTVALALVPEAIAFSFVAKVDPIVGLWSAVFLGLITSAFGGRPGMISGATGAIAVVVAKAVDMGNIAGAELGIDNLGMQYMFAAVMLAGVIQAMVAILKLGRFIRLVPHPVMMGFVNGLAIVILISQFKSFQTADGQWLATNQLLVMSALALLTMVIIKFFPRISNAIPSILVAIVAVGMLSFFNIVDTKTVSDVLLEGTGSGQLRSALPGLSWPGDIVWNQETIMLIGGVGVAVAMVGLIESLMTLQLIDDMTETRGQGNRECFAQGGANFLSGLFGGMGGCAMIGQSLINIRSGGRGRISGVVAALALIAFIVVGGPIIVQIPVAALVGVMFMVVIGTFEWATFRTFGKVPKADIFVIFVVTLTTVFLHNLALAVFVGVVVSALVFAWKSAHHVRLMPQDIAPGVRVYNLQGVLYFGSVREFSERLTPADDPDEVIIDFKEARVVDYSSLEALNAITERYRNAGKTLRMRHLSTECQKMITAAGNLIVIEVAADDPHYSVARI